MIFVYQKKDDPVLSPYHPEDMRSTGQAGSFRRQAEDRRTGNKPGSADLERNNHRHPVTAERNGKKTGAGSAPKLSGAAPGNSLTDYDVIELFNRILLKTPGQK